MKALVTVVAFFVVGLFAWAIISSPSTPHQTVEVEIPAATGHINDYSNVISDETESSLEELLTSLSDNQNLEIAVLTIPSTQPLDITQYGIKVGDAWKVGDAETDTGVIFIVATEDRQVRIEVGSGAEAHITDSRAGQILDEDVVPFLKNGDWDGGIKSGVISIVEEMTE